MSQEEIQSLKDVANKLRIHSVESTTAAGSGHPTSCSSMADIMSVLFFKTMKYTVSEPKAANNDRFVLSKGHAAPILYAAWAEAGLFPTSELMKLRKLESDLEGHPTPRLNFIDVATGSLGQGLSIACGMAYCGMHYDKSPYRTYCLMGDGESMEGNVWEAFNFAGFYKLDNLCAIIDVNRLGQSDPAPLGHDMEAYRLRLNSFGFHSIVVDGHDVGELIRAFDEAEKTKGKPTCILAKTYKGYNFPSVVNQENWHGKSLGLKSEEIIDHLKTLLKAPDASNPKIKSPVAVAPIVDISGIKLSKPPYYRIGDSLATREAYGTGLVKIAQDNDRVVALDGDMKNSTFSLNLRKVMPERHIECFICEQNLAGVGIGLACRDRTVVFVSTFACFLTRAYDNFRMGVISQTNVNVVGSHCGVSIGEDGPSQMALEDLSMFRSLPGCTIFYPSDAVSTERAVELAANTRGICYIRVSRPATKVIYPNDTIFAIGKSIVVKQTMSDKVLIIAGGITLQKALEAASELAQSGTNVRVMDIFTVKPVDKEGIIKNATECGNKILTVEDHYPEGGIGDAVLDVISMEDIKLKKLAVREVPRSGPPMVLLEKYGIGKQAVIDGVNSLI
ncbi:transketolase-like protein 2 [Lepeophtheirus salmonis]|uniref:transketolase-like protein 2 n=1 Tax=Lepeophtheirus salmonis TaxID=72036 RepID=UPI001AE39DB7|nr:transketolase-like protein 2 [Lepeophtheirus salmonis]